VLLAALSSSHKLGLGLAGLAFCSFALISSMVIPRSNPDFPGKHRNTFIAVSFVFFAVMLTAVWIFGKANAQPEKHVPVSAPLAERL